MNLDDYAEDHSLKILGVSVVLLVAAVGVTGTPYLLDDRDDEMSRIGMNSQNSPGQITHHNSERDDIDDMPEEELSDQEIEDLKYVREEEKLAHDVYTRLSQEYDIRVLENVASSEQRHTNAVETLIEKYGLEDPYDEELGTFEHEEISEMYDKLVGEGLESETAALKVAAEVEEIDIVDLDKKIENTDNEDITQVYTNLRKGSERHLSAFDRQLNIRDASYEPNHISKSRYNDITEETRHGPRR